METLCVLMYHDLRPRDLHAPGNPGPILTASDRSQVLPPPLTVFQEDFATQMEFLVREGYSVVSPQAVVDFYRRGTPLPVRAVLVTFDDLWKGGLSAAYPVLRGLGLGALAFMVRSWVFDGPQEPAPGRPVCLSWSELPALGDVFTLANHTDRLHSRGPDGPALLSVPDDEFLADLARCEEKTTLKGVFAYPYGVPGPRTPELLARAGFDLAFTTEAGINTRSTDRFRLRRNLVPGGAGLDLFAKILEG